MAVELTDDEARAALAAQQLIRQLGGNSAARGHLENAIKVLKPDLKTSAEAVAEIQKPLMEQIEAMRAEQKARDDKAAEETKAAAEAAALNRLESSFTRLRQNEGLTETGEQKVREIMRDRQIYDPEAAFALFERQNPKPVNAESSWTPERWNYQKDAVDDTKALFADPEGWGDETAGQVLIEMRRGRDE